MSAAYDTFDYPSYWIGRDYEHKSEIVAIKAFLEKIKKIKTILEVGAGFGRLTPAYAFRARKIILTDPSSRTLKMAREAFSAKTNIKYVHSSLENLTTKIRANSIDLLIIVRVIHHLKNIKLAFKILSRTVKPGGYLILEFANKRHLKASVRHVIKGNFSFMLDKEPNDIRSKTSIENGSLPFLNYHPESIEVLLNQFGFEVLEKRSVSNIRSTFIKKLFSTELLIFMESILQVLFSYMDLGPSIFVLAKKNRTT